jgi:hypothetical protein
MAAGPWILLSLFPVNSNKGTCYRKLFLWITGVCKPKLVQEVWQDGGWALDSSLVVLVNSKKGTYF